MWKKFQNRRNPLRGHNFDAAFNSEYCLTEAAMRELGRTAAGGVLESPVRGTEAVESPVNRRMHGAELRPSLMNTWDRVHKAERIMMTEDTLAVSKGVIDMVAHLAEHLSSSEAQTHLSVADLLGRAGLDGDIAARIGTAYQLANPEDPSAQTL